MSGKVYTLKKEYLATLAAGAQAITFDMSGGTYPVLTVAVNDSTPGNDSGGGSYNSGAGIGGMTALAALSLLNLLKTRK